MAVVTLLGTQTFNTTSGTHTVTATPAVGDLLVIVRANTGNTTSTAPTDNNPSTSSWVLVNSAVKASSADKIEVWVQSVLVNSATSTVFTDAAGTTTGGGLAVFKITGMSFAGSAAIRQSAVQSNQAAGTPAPVFTSAPLSSNAIIGAVFNATSPATLTPRTSFTERFDVGYSTPTTGLETMTRDSGETATTQTWGSSSASAFCSIVVELDTSVPNSAPTVALNTQDVANFDSGTPTLLFTGTDANSDAISYETLVWSPPIDSYDETNASTVTFVYPSSGTNQVGQSFTGNGDTIGAVMLWGNRLGSPTGNATVKIYAETHSTAFGTDSLPTGAALATSDSLNTANVSSALGWIVVPFSTPFTTTLGTEYVLGLEFTSGTGTNTNCLQVYRDTTSPTHAGNYVSGFNAYSASSSVDLVFMAVAYAIDKLSASDTGFADITNGAHTDPFTSGEKIGYTVQAGDTLANGKYFWRARGKDPSGSNTYGAWSGTQSFIVTPDPYIVQMAKYAGAAAQTNMTFTLPSTPTVGNLLIAQVLYYTGDNPFLTPTGWTLKEHDDTNQSGIATIYRWVQAGDTASWNLTVLTTADQNSGFMYEVAGADTTTPFNQYSYNEVGTAGTSITSNSITPTVNGCMILTSVVSVASGGSDASAVSSGWSELQYAHSTFQPAWLFEKDIKNSDTTTALSTTVSGLPSGQIAAVIMAIAPVGGGGGGPTNTGQFFAFF